MTEMPEKDYESIMRIANGFGGAIDERLKERGMSAASRHTLITIALEDFSKTVKEAWARTQAGN